MLFINRKIISKATFALLLTATVLASCSSNDSSSTGRIKNSVIDGQLCYYGDERANLLLSAVAIEGRAAVTAQPAVAYRAKVEYKAAVVGQAKKLATAAVPKGSISPEVAARPAVQGQAAVPGSAAVWEGFGVKYDWTVGEVKALITKFPNGYRWVSQFTSFEDGNGKNYTYREATPGQPAILAQDAIPFQAANPPQDIPAGAEVPEVLKQDEVEEQDEVRQQDEVEAQDAVEGKTLDQVKDEINEVVSCDSLTGPAITPTTDDSSPSSATSDSELPTCISEADKEVLLNWYDWRIKLTENDVDKRFYVQYTNSRNNMANRDICAGTEVSKVVFVAIQTTNSTTDDSSSSPTTVAAGSPTTVAAGSPTTVAAESPTTVAAESPTTVAAESPTTVAAGSPTTVESSPSSVPVDMAASVPAAVLTVEKPVVLLKEVVTEVVVAPTEVQELVAVAGFVEGTVEVQVENAEGLSEWLVIDSASFNTVALGDGAKSIKYRVTSKDTSQPVVEKTVEIARLSVATEVKGVLAEIEAASADQSALNPTVEVEKSSGSKTVIWVAIFIMLLIAVIVFGMQKKKKNDANSNTNA